MDDTAIAPEQVPIGEHSLPSSASLQLCVAGPPRCDHSPLDGLCAAHLRRRARSNRWGHSLFSIPRIFALHSRSELSDDQCVNSINCTSRERSRWPSWNHTPVDLTAFNTDGFDVSGQNIHIHDCSVWNQDDTFAIKVTALHVLPTYLFVMVSDHYNMNWLFYAQTD